MCPLEGDWGDRVHGWAPSRLSAALAMCFNPPSWHPGKGMSWGAGPEGWPHSTDGDIHRRN